MAARLVLRIDQMRVGVGKYQLEPLLHVTSHNEVLVQQFYAVGIELETKCFHVSNFFISLWPSQTSLGRQKHGLALGLQMMI